MPDSTSDWCFILPLITGAVGYIIRARLSDQASSRKEDWEKINKLTDQINDLNDVAVEFYCNPPSTQGDRKKLGLKIQGMLRRIRQAVLSLPFDRPSPNFDGHQQRLRQATTLDLSENATGPLDVQDSTIQNISTTCGSYIGAIQLAYRRKYRPGDRQ